MEYVADRLDGLVRLDQNNTTKILVEVSINDNNDKAYKDMDFCQIAARSARREMMLPLMMEIVAENKTWNSGDRKYNCNSFSGTWIDFRW